MGWTLGPRLTDERSGCSLSHDGEKRNPGPRTRRGGGESGRPIGRRGGEDGKNIGRKRGKTEKMRNLTEKTGSTFSILSYRRLWKTCPFGFRFSILLGEFCTPSRVESRVVIRLITFLYPCSLLGLISCLTY